MKMKKAGKPKWLVSFLLKAGVNRQIAICSHIHKELIDRSKNARYFKNIPIAIFSESIGLF